MFACPGLPSHCWKKRRHLSVRHLGLLLCLARFVSLYLPFFFLSFCSFFVPIFLLFCIFRSFNIFVCLSILWCIFFSRIDKQIQGHIDGLIHRWSFSKWLFVFAITISESRINTGGACISSSQLQNRHINFTDDALRPLPPKKKKKLYLFINYC